MKNQYKIGLAVACVFSFACASDTAGRALQAESTMMASNARVPVAMPTAGEIEGQRTYGVPMQMPGHTTWLSSFVITKHKAFYRDKDPFVEGGLAVDASTKSARPSPRLITRPIRWHNAAFVDRADGSQWTLLEDRGFLSHWWVVTQPVDNQWVSSLQVFAATIDDTNGDGTLDNKDACVAILVGGDGRNARIVTPRNTQLNTVRLHENAGYVTFELRFDSDKNGKFDKEDDLRLYYLSKDQIEGPAVPWHGAEFESQLESVYR